jgi:hypothetical protein
MNFTGLTYRAIPETNRIRLSLGEVSILGTGKCEVGISGSGTIDKFTFSGNKILSPANKVVGNYNEGENFSLDYIADTGNYIYYLNGNLIENRRTKTNYNTQKFFVNCSGGASLSSDVKLYCDDVPFTITFPDKFQALGNLTGSLSNLSTTKFKIFDSSLNFYHTSLTLLTGVTSGDSTGQTNFGFSFYDNNTSRFDQKVDFGLTLYTSLGTIQQTFTSNRVSGLEMTISDLITDTTNANLNSIFDGSGISGNQFIYINSPVNYLVSYYAPSTNLRGEQKNKTINISIEAVSPLNNGTGISSYVTGFQLLTSGEYLYPPIAKFTGYYYITGLSTALNSILLNSGCTGDVPITFSGNNSRALNASGVLHSVRVLLSGMYGEGLNYYYLPQSFEIISGGTGYLTTPNAYIKTGTYSNCWDLGTRYTGNYSIFRPFSGAGMLGSLADYLTGEVLTVTGLVSGGAITGYRLSGIRFTNMGSGYNTGNYKPFVSFERVAGDTLTSGASGNLLMKSTGSYIFANNWSLSTGSSTLALNLMSGTSGVINLDSGSNYLTVNLNYSGSDYTQAIVARLTTSMVGGDTITHLLSGLRTYDTSTGYLKKKNNLDLITFTINDDLSFSLTESDIDLYYSSPNFMNSGNQIAIGDLEF